MTSMFDGEYEPPSQDWVRDQVERFEASGGTEANTLMDTGIPIIVMTTIGAKSGKRRKAPVMRVEDGGRYAIVASKGGTPENPGWYHNLVETPRVRIQDGGDIAEYDVRQLEGDERERWWEKAVAVFPPYAKYQQKTDRVIPVFEATRAS